MLLQKKWNHKKCISGAMVTKNIIKQQKEKGAENISDIQSQKPLQHLFISLQQ